MDLYAWWWPCWRSVLMQLGAEWMVQLISGSSEPVVLENGARYLLWNAPFYAVLGVLLATRYALQSLGQKVLPLFSSVIELVGKMVFVLFFIPRFAYNAVILCEPIIWCFMAATSWRSTCTTRLCFRRSEKIRIRKNALPMAAGLLFAGSG